jgi:hypothetical protein
VTAASLLGPGPASANTYRPNKINDHRPNGCGNKDCTLREALIKANRHDGGDKLVLEGGETYTLKREGIGEDSARRGDLDVNGSLKIVSSDGRLATVDGDDIDRVFQTGTDGPVKATFKRIHVTGGNGEFGGSFGGGISGGEGKLKILNSRVSDNLSGLGAGVQAAERTVIDRSTISGNGRIEVGEGGGLTILGDAEATVRDSTINGNRSVFGGGIEVEVGGASLTLINSTVTKNRAEIDGAGIQAFEAGEIEVMSSTIARNSAGQDGGGLHRDSADLFTVRNSIIALNSAGGSGPDCEGGFGAIERNLLTDLSGCGGFSMPSAIVANPRLRQLADNGGPTETIALKDNSPAINKGGASSPPRDQRGVDRGNNPDIGSFELR